MTSPSGPNLTAAQPTHTLPNEPYALLLARNMVCWRLVWSILVVWSDAGLLLARAFRVYWSSSVTHRWHTGIDRYTRHRWHFRERIFGAGYYHCSRDVMPCERETKRNRASKSRCCFSTLLNQSIRWWISARNRGKKCPVLPRRTPACSRNLLLSTHSSYTPIPHFCLPAHTCV